MTQKEREVKSPAKKGKISQKTAKAAVLKVLHGREHSKAAKVSAGKDITQGNASEFKPNEFAERRAEEQNDCRLWSSKDALLACLRDIESGEINPERLVIHYTERIDDVTTSYRYYASNVTTMEHAGLLAMITARVAAQ